MGKGENIQWCCYDAEKKLRKEKTETLRKLHPELFSYIFIYLYLIIVIAITARIQEVWNGSANGCDSNKLKYLVTASSNLFTSCLE